MSTYLDSNLKIVGRSIELRQLLDELRQAYVYSYKTEAWKELFNAATDALSKLEKALIDQATQSTVKEEAYLTRAVDSLKDR